MTKFNDKVILVTGAAGGIGKELVKQVVASGAKVSLVDLNKDALESVVKDLKLTDENSLIIPADVSKEEEVKNYVEKTIEKFGKIDGFFNNAGVEGKTANVEDFDSDVFNFVFDVNVKGAFYGLKYVIPAMKKQKSGSVVNTASLAGLIGSPGFVAYNASKHALIGMTRVVAQEVVKDGIRVNALAPGPINTRMMRQIEENVIPGEGEKAQEAFKSAIPMGRYGEAEEVANVAFFLLSDDASYVAQSIYTVDGGMIGQ